MTDHVNSAQSRNHGYDDLDRLTWDSRVSASTTYTYDGNGNRLTRTSKLNQTVHPALTRVTPTASVPVEPRASAGNRDCSAARI